MLDLGLGVRAQHECVMFVLIDEGEIFSLLVETDDQRCSYTISKEKGRQPVHDADRAVVTSVTVKDQWHVKDVDPQPFIERLTCVAS